MDISRHLIAILFLGSVVLSGCDLLMRDHHGDAVKSPSGAYSVFATVNRTDKNLPDYAYVVLHLNDASGHELEVYRSRAGDANKWALGWMEGEDVVILQSYDVGSMAFQIENNVLMEIPTLSDEMIARAVALKVQKYGAQR